MKTQDISTLEMQIKFLREELRLTKKMLEMVRKRNQEADRMIRDSQYNMELSRENLRRLMQIDRETKQGLENTQVDIENLRLEYKRKGGVEDE